MLIKVLSIINNEFFGIAQTTSTALYSVSFNSVPSIEMNDLFFFPSNVNLDTKFKIKYICDTEFSREERNLDVEKIVEIMKEKNIVAEEVYELENSEEQIRFELFKVIQNNFVISKCENCGRLFIPATTNNNPYQKARKINVKILPKLPLNISAVFF